MRLSEGVEWGLHCCLSLALLGDAEPVSTAKLAESYELPPAYLNKCLQALVRGGILTSTAGARGGYRLARPPREITFLDVVTAVEGPEEAFRCTEIRQRGAGATGFRREFLRPCGIASAMRKAEMAWRQELASFTIADVIATTPPSVADRVRNWHATAKR
jgi:Rrf2 family protein